MVWSLSALHLCSAFALKSQLIDDLLTQSCALVAVVRLIHSPARFMRAGRWACPAQACWSETLQFQWVGCLFFLCSDTTLQVTTAQVSISTSCYSQTPPLPSVSFPFSSPVLSVSLLSFSCTYKENRKDRTSAKDREGWVKIKPWRWCKCRESGLCVFVFAAPRHCSSVPAGSSSSFLDKPLSQPVMSVFAELPASGQAGFSYLPYWSWDWDLLCLYFCD